MKRSLLVLACCLVLAVCVALALPALAPESRLREEAQRVIREDAGLEPQIVGPVTFSLLPRPALRLEGVTFPGLAPAALSTREMVVNLDFVPLMTGRVRASRIDLVAPDLLLAAADPDAVVDRLPAIAASLAPPTRRVHVRVWSGRVRVAHGGDSETLLQDIEGELAWRGGRDLVVDGRMNWKSEPLDFDLRLAQLAELAKGEAGTARLSLSGAAFTMSFDGETKLVAGPVADGDLQVDVPKLRSLLDWLDVPAPTHDGFAHLALRARTHLAVANATLTDAQFDIDGNKSEGGLTVKMDHGRMVLRGSFAATDIDLSPYGRLSVSGPDGHDWNREPLDIGALEAVDLDLRLSAGRVHTGDTAFQNVAASAVLKDGRLALTLGEAQAWGGSFQAAAVIEPSAALDTAKVRLELDGADVDLAAALRDLLKLQRLEGTGAFQIALNGVGGSISDMMESLGGTMAMTAADGAVVGFDVARLLDRLSRRPLSGGGDFRGGHTAFDRLEAKATIDRGTAYVDSFTIDSTVLRIALAGRASIALRDLDLSGTASLIKSSDTGTGSGFDLPFVVQGSWADPIVLPDPQALIRRSGAVRPLLGANPSQATPASTP